MSHPLIRSCCEVRPASADRRRARREAERLRAEQPRLRFTGDLARLRCRGLRPARVLHLDDMSGITLPSWRGSMSFLEDRARLRAGEGDLIATRIRPAAGYETYCRRSLGLGRVRWIRARADRRSLAAACWVDQEVRETLCSADISYVHPHMGSFAVWALSDLLRRSTRRDIQVIAPPPALCAAANNKVWVAELVRRVLGESRIPRSYSAANFSTMAAIVRELARDSVRIVIKMPDSVGGGGNLVLDAAPLRGLELGALRGHLRKQLAPLEWKGDVSLLVGCWENDVLAAPSVQTWIPPLDEGEPVVEGLFEQIIEGRAGLFVGCRPARLPPDISYQALHETWLLAYTLQLLGYVGRCSFDLILVGEDPARSRLEFVECNARWGGTSLPMTLVHRLEQGDSIDSYACLDCEVDGALDEAEGGSLPALLDRLAPHLFDRRSKRGDIVLFNPGALSHGEIAAIGLGKAFFEAPERLVRTVREARQGDRAPGCDTSAPGSSGADPSDTDRSGAGPARPRNDRSAA